MTRSGAKRWALIPIVLSLVVFFAAYFAMDSATAELRESLSAASWMPEWLRGVVRGVLRFVIFVIFVAIAWFTATPITQALASPVLEILVGRVDFEKRGVESSVHGTWFGDITFTLVQASLSLAFSLLLTISAFALAFVPVVGLLLGPLTLAASLGFAAVDIAGGRRRWTLGQKLGVFQSNFGALLGFGLAGLGIALVPGLTIFVGIPAVALGGTLLLYNLELRAARRIA